MKGKAIYLGAMGYSGRQNGLTTAMIDLAIANARANNYVQFCSPNTEMSRQAFEKAIRRLEQTDTFNGVQISDLNGDRTLLFGMGKGRLEFLSTTPKPVLSGQSDCRVSDFGAHGQLEMEN